MTVAPAFWSAFQNFRIVQVEWRQVVEEPQPVVRGKLRSEVKMRVLAHVTGAGSHKEEIRSENAAVVCIVLVCKVAHSGFNNGTSHIPHIAPAVHLRHEGAQCRKQVVVVRTWQVDPIMDVNRITLKTQVHCQPVCAAALLSENILLLMVHGDVGRKHNPFESREVGLCTHPFQDFVEVAVNVGLRDLGRRQWTQDAHRRMNWGDLWGQSVVGQRRLDIPGNQGQNSVVQPGIHGVRGIGRRRQATKVSFEAGRTITLSKILQNTNTTAWCSSPQSAARASSTGLLCGCACVPPCGSHSKTEKKKKRRKTKSKCKEKTLHPVW